MKSNLKNSKERMKEINDLKKQAEEVLKLRKKLRPKRPIIIEFSGSPKSGKTSCINSLEKFLKRNGFSVKIIHEMASVCPVDNKKSPMFNIWTVFRAISDLLGVLGNKEVYCDVLILDRGIFDSLCWFQWLSTKKYMGADHKMAIENFLLHDYLVNKIDIVCKCQY